MTKKKDQSRGRIAVSREIATIGTDELVNRYLGICRVEEGVHRYTIGPFFRSGVTLLKQQVRALNLVYSLASTKILSGTASVAVIGGGVAGVTAAAAASSLGAEVYLFEQRPVLCHLQNGCDTRWIHPHIYDWPELGSENPYAGLPLLDWQADTAAGVARQILSGFERIRADPTKRLQVHLGASTWLSDRLTVHWDNSNGEPRGSERTFDIVLLATGFGVEMGVREGETQSYWRNDSVNQPMPGGAYEKPTQYFISGPGDGGLIDLLRTRIQSFSQGRFIEDLFSRDNPADEKLLGELRAIARDWTVPEADRPKPLAWLFDRFMKLRKEGFLDELRKRLDKQLRSDTAAILNGRAKTFSETLRLDRASLLNTLIAFLLYDLKAFSYVCGDSECKGTNVTIKQDPFGLMGQEKFVVKYNVDRLIVRNGTNRAQVLNLLGLSSDLIEAVKQSQEFESGIRTTEPLWPAGWWWKHQTTLDWSGHRESVEFVPPATVSIATTFVSTLSDILILLLKQESTKQSDGLQSDAKHVEFRITLHRLIKDPGTGKTLFQQIAYYAGTRTEGSPGRVVDVEVGIVGLAIRTGEPIVVRSGANWSNLWDQLKVNKDSGVKSIADSVASMLTCPFFAPAEKRDDPSARRKVSLVLFMDSQNRDFFTEQVLRIVFSASAGFVKNLEKLAKENTVRFASSSFLGYDVASRDDDRKLIDSFTEIEPKPGVFKEFSDDLTFKTVKSFDIYLRA